MEGAVPQPQPEDLTLDRHGKVTFSRRFFLINSEQKNIQAGISRHPTSDPISKGGSGNTDSLFH